MFKLIFVLIISNSSAQGGLTNVEFNSLKECESAKVQIKKEIDVVSTCVEKKIPIKKTKCKIINNFDYKNKLYRIEAGNLNGYPYPVEVECVEE